MSLANCDVTHAMMTSLQADLDDHANELKTAEENAKRAMADASRLTEELRHEQEHSGQIEKMRRALEAQVKEVQVRISGTIFLLNGTV